MTRFGKSRKLIDITGRYNDGNRGEIMFFTDVVEASGSNIISIRMIAIS